jgi:hypothetical protein
MLRPNRWPSGGRALVESLEPGCVLSQESLTLLRVQIRRYLSEVLSGEGIDSHGEGSNCPA